jgi:hypothetical protein
VGDAKGLEVVLEGHWPPFLHLCAALISLVRATQRRAHLGMVSPV